MALVGEITVLPEMRFAGKEHVHLVGIGGAGLSAIARVLCQEGFTVSGSDRADSPVLRQLAELGARVAVGHSAAHVAGADLLLISSAVREDNPEVQAARQSGLPVLKRSQFLGRLLSGRNLLAVAGTHGKTTTTGMVIHLARSAGRQTGYIVGAELPGLSNADAGDGSYFVIEADEYDNMFLGLRPRVVVLTTVEWDHVDCFPNRGIYEQAFAHFVARLPLAEGTLVASADDVGAERIWGRRPAGLHGVTYSVAGADGALWRAEDLHPNGCGGLTFIVWRGKERLGEAVLAVPGVHNVSNALGALAALAAWGLEPATLLSYLSTFRGAARRFELKGEEAGVTVYDDYGHHPTEVRATLAAARSRLGHRPLWVLFQPHTYSRTAAFLAQWRDAFGDADHVLVTDIYAARETDTLGLDGGKVAAALAHPDARYVGSVEQAAQKLALWLQPGDVLLTLGAGTSVHVGEMVLRLLQERGNDRRG